MTYGWETGSFQSWTSYDWTPSLTGQWPQVIAPALRTCSGTVSGAQPSNALTTALYRNATANSIRYSSVTPSQGTPARRDRQHRNSPATSSRRSRASTGNPASTSGAPSIAASVRRARHGNGAMPPKARTAVSTEPSPPRRRTVVALTSAWALTSRNATFCASTAASGEPVGSRYRTITRSSSSLGSARTRSMRSATLNRSRAPSGAHHTTTSAPTATSAVSRSDGNGSPAWTCASTSMVLPASEAALRTMVPAVRRAMNRSAPRLPVCPYARCAITWSSSSTRSL